MLFFLIPSLTQTHVGPLLKILRPPCNILKISSSTDTEINQTKQTVVGSPALWGGSDSARRSSWHPDCPAVQQTAGAAPLAWGWRHRLRWELGVPAQNQQVDKTVLKNADSREPVLSIRE